MTTQKQVNDGFGNFVTGLGVANPKTAAAGYGTLFMEWGQQHLDAAYLGSTWFGKIVDIPADDATRQWRKWEAKKEQIEKLEATEKKLGVRQKVRQALIWSRLYGGAVLIPLGLPGSNESELDPASVRADSITGLSVVSRWDVTAEGVIRDVLSPRMGYPESLILNGQDGQQKRLHPSRFILIPGKRAGTLTSMVDCWGHSIWAHLHDAVTAADGGAAVIDALLQEAKIDIIRVPGMMENMATTEYEALMLRRFTLANRLKSVANALLLDVEDEYAQKQISFAGLPEVANVLLKIMSGAADIPVTRLTGEQQTGLSGADSGSLRNYYDSVKSKQELVLEPTLTPLDEMLIYNSLGNRPPEVWYSWNELYQMTEKEKADIDKQEADTANTYALTGLIPLDALAESTQNRMVESGRWPGLEQALKNSTMEIELPNPNEEEPETQGGNTPRNTQATSDAAPRTLYVRRDVKNAAEIIEHFKKQGLQVTIPADDMHVTIVYSRDPVDWMQMGAEWEEEVKIPAGGPRLMEKFGDATVLLFASHSLQWRHEEMLRRGASSDHSEFNPHVTISWQFEGDVANLLPWNGKIVLGPETFQEIKEDWKETLVEDSE